MEPARLGMVAGCFFAGVAALVLFVRQQLGVPMEIAGVVLGVAKTFVISYFAAGLFVVYLLWIAERELPPPDEPKKRAGLKGAKPGKASDQAPSAEGFPGEGASEIDAIADALDRLNADRASDADSRPQD